jgi:hypothetical protein
VLTKRARGNNRLTSQLTLLSFSSKQKEGVRGSQICSQKIIFRSPLSFGETRKIIFLRSIELHREERGSERATQKIGTALIMEIKCEETKRERKRFKAEKCHFISHLALQYSLALCNVFSFSLSLSSLLNEAEFV